MQGHDFFLNGVPGNQTLHGYQPLLADAVGPVRSLRFDGRVPPGKEGLHVPTQFVNLGYLFGSEITAISGNPAGFARNRIADKAQRGTVLLHSLLARQHLDVVEDDSAGSPRKGLKAGLDGVLRDAADTVLACGLELVEIVMALVSPGWRIRSTKGRSPTLPLARKILRGIPRLRSKPICVLAFFAPLRESAQSIDRTASAKNCTEPFRFAEEAVAAGYHKPKEWVQ